MTNRYLIIGLGFIGINLLRELWLRGHTVTVYTQRLDERLIEAFGNQVTFIKGDLRDKANLDKAIKNQDVIFALAGRSGQAASLKEPFLDLEVNVQGHLYLLEALKEHNPRARVMFPGSRLEYGKPLYLPVDEAHPLNPVSLYGIHKLTTEKYYLEYHTIFGLNTIALRITNPYGAHLLSNHHEYNIVNYFIDLALAGKPITLYGDGSQLRDYIYVEDLAKVMITLADNPKAIGHVINVGTGRGVSLKAMAELIATDFEVDVKGVSWPEEVRQVETGDFIADISFLRAVLAEEISFFGIEDGIGATKQLMSVPSDTFWSKLAPK